MTGWVQQITWVPVQRVTPEVEVMPDPATVSAVATVSIPHLSLYLNNLLLSLPVLLPIRFHTIIASLQ